MHALVHDPDSPQGLRLGEAPEPQQGASQVLVDVHATSLNFGEIAFLHDRHNPGDVAGWDAAGIVVAPAADGSGPPTGSRVVTFGWGGAWAQRRAVDIDQLAFLPATVEFGAAATLPVAAVTALRAVRRLGALIGRTIVITGASGGVGRFAVQLAARAGARVVAVVGSSARGAGLAELGAAEVVVGVGGLTGPFDGVIDNVSVGDRFGEDLVYLVALLAHGELDPQIGWRGSWDRASEAAALLLGRRVRGKTVLEVEQ